LPKASVDVVFIDPPFQSDLFTPAMKAALGVLKASGWMYVESPQKLDPEAMTGLGLECTKYLKAGQVHAHLLHRIQ
jgi:hypothetical protein